MLSRADDDDDDDDSERTDTVCDTDTWDGSALSSGSIATDDDGTVSDSEVPISSLVISRSESQDD